MSTGCKILDQYGLHFCTFTVVQWADLFSRQVYREIMVRNFNHCIANKGLHVHGYVFMTNHIHCILSAAQGNLSGVIRDLKSFSAKQIYAQMLQGPESRQEWLELVFRYAAGGHSRNQDFQIWQHDNHPEEIFSLKFLMQKMNYIHNNPVQAGWVCYPEHWRYSSAADYLNGEQVGPVNISFLDFR